MAHMCEGTMHSKELPKQYLESIKTVKQVDSIRTRSTSKGRGHGRGHGHSQNRHRSQSKSKPGSSSNRSNCGSIHPPKRCKAFGKECYCCHKKGHFHNTAGLNNGEDHPPNPDTTLDNHDVMSMT